MSKPERRRKSANDPSFLEDPVRRGMHETYNEKKFSDALHIPLPQTPQPSRGEQAGLDVEGAKEQVALLNAPELAELQNDLHPSPNMSSKKSPSRKRHVSVKKSDQLVKSDVSADSEAKQSISLNAEEKEMIEQARLAELKKVQREIDCLKADLQSSQNMAKAAKKQMAAEWSKKFEQFKTEAED